MTGATKLRARPRLVDVFVSCAVGYVVYAAMMEAFDQGRGAYLEGWDDGAAWEKRRAPAPEPADELGD